MTQSERIFLAQLNVLWPVLDPLPSAVLAVSWRGRILFANRVARRLLGPEPDRKMLEDALAQGGVTRDSGGRVGAAALGVLRALGGKAVESEELRVRVRGTPMALRVSTAPIQGPDGRAVGVLVLLADVTALVLSEERARLLARIGQALVSAQQPGALAEQVADLLAQGLGAACAVFLVGWDGGDFTACHGVFSPPLRTAAERAIVRQDLFRDGETLAMPLCHDRRTLGALALTGSFSAADEAVVRQIATLLALALENTRLYDETRKTAEAKDAVLAVASHEITSPMAALAGYGELMVRVLADDPPNLGALRRAADGIKRTAERVQELSSRLLDSERIRTGQLTIERRSVDLLPALREAVDRAAVASGREITFEDRVRALHGKWDIVRLQQVLDNLLSNALRYSQAGTPVRVIAEQRGNEAVLTVEDCGIGIAEADRARIFEAFQRGANATFGGPGLGLGLYLAAEIIKAHGGRVTVDSEVGRGTVFRILLPLL